MTTPTTTSTETGEDVRGRAIVHDWMLHLGYTPEEIAAADDGPDHSECQRDGAGVWYCGYEDGQNRHPVHHEMGQVAELVMFTLEHPAVTGGAS